MSFIQKPKNTPELPPGDPLWKTYLNARNEWDERIGDAVSSAKQWRLSGQIMASILTFSIGCNLYQSVTRDHRPIVIIARDRVGDVVAVSVPKTEQATPEPNSADVASAMKRWIKDTRSLYADANAIKDGIKEAYRMTDAGSVAAQKLDRRYTTKGQDPIKLAESETVQVERRSASPDPGTVDEKGFRTWRVQWREITMSRDDGSVISDKNWYAVITFRISPPKTTEDVAANPDGIKVVDFQWDEQ